MEFVSLATRDYTVWVTTRGTVRPRTESTLIPEVSGRVTTLAGAFRAGEFFEHGDVLLQIDPRDYEAEVVVAEANVAQARSALAEEQARADQARREWQRLGERGTPDALVVRKPQLTGARAAVRSAQARLTQARLNLERTTIRAPYAGRVLEQNVDVGQYVTPGTTVAHVYAVDYAEVRLPLSNRQLEFVPIPEIYRREINGKDNPIQREPGLALELLAPIGTRTYTWAGTVVRAEGAIDTQSRQLFVVEQVDDPYGKQVVGRPPLKVGQFVEARIQGRTLNDVFVIPRAALRAGSEVHLLDADDRVRSRPVRLLYSEDRHAVIHDGLETGERLVVTALGAGMIGLQVKPVAQGARVDGPRSRPKSSRGKGRPKQPS